jgi:serine/threonine-protein kinase
LKVVDFGIARALASISEDEKAEIVWGSPQYFAPEQAAGKAPSPASDVYSLGVVLFEMLTGQLPFIADNPEELARQHREVLPPSPRKLNPAIPPALEQIMLKVLAKEPAARYRTADQMGRILTRYIDGTLTGPQPAAPQVATTTAVQPPPTRPVAPRPTGTSAPQRVLPRPSAPPLVPELEATTPPFDWVTWSLGLVALLAVGGLIPFCLWVYYAVAAPF